MIEARSRPSNPSGRCSFGKWKRTCPSGSRVWRATWRIIRTPSEICAIRPAQPKRASAICWHRWRRSALRPLASWNGLLLRRNCLRRRLCRAYVRAHPHAATVPKASGNRGWRSYAIAAVVIIGIVSAVVLCVVAEIRGAGGKQCGGGEVSSSARSSARDGASAYPIAPPPAAAPVEKSQMHRVMHVDIEAREPAWVAITDASGKRLMAKTLEAERDSDLGAHGGRDFAHRQCRRIDCALQRKRDWTVRADREDSGYFV